MKGECDEPARSEGDVREGKRLNTEKIPPQAIKLRGSHHPRHLRIKGLFSGIILLAFNILPSRTSPAFVATLWNDPPSKGEFS